MAQTPNRIQYIDGIRFKRILCAAAKRLIDKHEHLDEINVFPVPDGDTGKNMAGTMRSIVDGVSNSLDQSIDKMSKIIAEAALLGARGNSGVILAQFFCGFSEGVKDLCRLTPQQFADAASEAARRAKESMANPKEGTILTVITDWADHMKANCEKYSDFPDLLQDSYKRVQVSLEETSEKLAALKTAGVVDAGAQGFVYLLDGIRDFVEQGRLDMKIEKDILQSGASGKVQERVAVEDLTFQFCTECMLRGKDIDRDALRTELAELGDSLIVAGTSETVRVHVHVNDPHAVFAIAETYGEISNKKIDDMLKQHRDLLAKAKQHVGIITDSCCDLPADFLKEYGIGVAPLTLTLNGKEFIDKIDITPAEFNSQLRQSESAKTSQPAPSEFKSLYDGMLENYENIVAIHVTAANSGTMQGSRAIANNLDSAEHIQVLDGNNLTVGLGLVVREAALAASRGLTAAEVADVARDAARRVRIFVTLDTLDFAVRGGRLSKKQGAIAKALNIKPVLTFDPETGKAEVIGKGLGRRHARSVLMKNVREVCKGKRNLRFAVAHVAAPKTCRIYKDLIWNHFGVEPLFDLEASPVLGCYSGLGAAAIAVLGD
ncbi:DegV family protein [Desulfobaculum bizertense]|uniref:DhaL domain-containing protein n=1 Tax=Desulfobaculum bizertense DSM 18034 TaxID=1121442 RepID=A0A1T4VJW4_9BACT|nr:DegV family protein [Desulfobaculum bizertense]UIJ38045.1 DegV family EDD domain-containing protein [Desulfobaculum bizertense]SKA65274.1 hypothetical protein SAMN02745702_00508 [Desulfobaculum bizertense DSM 18034]